MVTLSCILPDYYGHENSGKVQWHVWVRIEPQKYFGNERHRATRKLFKKRPEDMYETKKINDSCVLKKFRLKWKNRRLSAALIQRFELIKEFVSSREHLEKIQRTRIIILI